MLTGGPTKPVFSLGGGPNGQLAETWEEYAEFFNGDFRVLRFRPQFQPDADPIDGRTVAASNVTKMPNPRPPRKRAKRSGLVRAGGGMGTGQVVERSNRYGEHAVERPVTFREIFATLDKSARLDIGEVRIVDPAGFRSLWSTKEASRCTSWCEPLSRFTP